MQSLTQNVENTPYNLQDINNKIKIDEWKIFFNNCPKDEYVPEGFRYKRLSWYRISPTGFLELLPHAPLIQSKSYNPVHGDILRDYQPLEKELTIKKDFLFFVKNFSEYCNLKPEDVILVQLQRITCNKDQVGHPAVEGFHRDGVDWLGLMVVSRHNILGAETYLKDESDQIIFESTLQEGELLIIDDRKMLHYTTPIKSNDEALNHGYRDVIIITACSKSLMGDLRKSDNIIKQK
jgi:hypothetical protein